MPDDEKDKLTPNDQAVWDAYIKKNTKTTEKEISEDNFEKLLAEHRHEEDRLEESNEIEQPEQASQNSTKPFSSLKKNSNSSYQLDKNTEEKFCKGRIKIESKIDLHGLNQSQAYESLKNFIIKSFNKNCRCVLVVTGKGKSKSTSENWLEQGQGILKKNAPLWLSTPPINTYVIKTSVAQIKHGGAGALYVYLRRNKL